MPNHLLKSEKAANFIGVSQSAVDNRSVKPASTCTTQKPAPLRIREQNHGPKFTHSLSPTRFQLSDPVIYSWCLLTLFLDIVSQYLSSIKNRNHVFYVRSWHSTLGSIKQPMSSYRFADTSEKSSASKYWFSRCLHGPRRPVLTARGLWR